MLARFVASRCCYHTLRGMKWSLSAEMLPRERRWQCYTISFDAAMLSGAKEEKSGAAVCCTDGIEVRGGACESDCGGAFSVIDVFTLHMMLLPLCFHGATLD